MLNKIILASKSKVRKEILDRNNIESIVELIGNTLKIFFFNFKVDFPK